MSNQISIHIITTTVPGMDGKLDKLISQGAGLETQLSKDMADLQSELRATTDTSKENSKLQQVVSDWVTRKDEFDAQSGCLRALYFPEIYRRQDNVKQAHEKTFKWVMCDPNDNKDGGTNVLAGRGDTPSRKGHAFLDWLRSNDAHQNVFCVFGKPGAGKSTLMRFIAHHGRLRSALEIGRATGISSLPNTSSGIAANRSSVPYWACCALFCFKFWSIIDFLFQLHSQARAGQLVATSSRFRKTRSWTP
jgi:ATPase subunit of ABC transporter with duplicated ATPase domains